MSRIVSKADLIFCAFYLNIFPLFSSFFRRFFESFKGRTAFNVECDEQNAYPINQSDGSQNVLFAKTATANIGGLVGDANYDGLTAEEHIEKFFARETSVALAAGEFQFYTGAMEGLPICLEGKCVEDPKEEYDSLTNDCVDVNECDRWLVPAGSDKDLYTLYEEALRAGNDGAAEWTNIITTVVNIYDKNNILQTYTPSTSNVYEIARGAPNDMLCGLTGAKLPSVGASTYDATGAIKPYNLKECFIFIKEVIVLNKYRDCFDSKRYPSIDT